MVNNTPTTTQQNVAGDCFWGFVFMIPKVLKSHRWGGLSKHENWQNRAHACVTTENVVLNVQ